MTSPRSFQLGPNWLLPKNGRDFTPLERRLNRIPVFRYLPDCRLVRPRAGPHQVVRARVRMPSTASCRGC